MDVWSRVLGIDNNIYYTLAVGLLIITRLTAILMLVPFMGGKLVPPQVKITTAIALSFLIFPIVEGTLSAQIPDIGPAFTIYILKEVFIGVTIGFVTALLFQALEAAGQFLDTARGSSMASVLIPQLEESGPLFAQLKVQLAIVLFLVMNGHHYFLGAVFRSFVILPVDRFPDLTKSSAIMTEWLIRATADVLLIGLQLVLPAIIAIFLVDVVLGIANRAAPQLNVFFLGMPIKGYVGILFFLLAATYFASTLETHFRMMLRDVNYVIHALGGTYSG